MRTAFANGEEVIAGPDAPAAAICPVCGAKVLLKRHRAAYAYHHATSPACPYTWQAPVEPREHQPEPEYLVFIAAIREAIKDALDGGGPQALDWLFEQEPQAALALLLGLDAEQTWLATERTVKRLKRVIATGQGHQLRHWVVKNALEQALSLLEEIR